MPAVEDWPKRTHRVIDILTGNIAVIGLCTLAPIVNFVAFNTLKPRFSAGRALQYALVIGAAGLVVALVLQRLLTRTPRHFSRVDSLHPSKGIDPGEGPGTARVFSFAANHPRKAA